MLNKSTMELLISHVLQISFSQMQVIFLTIYRRWSCFVEVWYQGTNGCQFSPDMTDRPTEAIMSAVRSTTRGRARRVINAPNGLFSGNCCRFFLSWGQECITYQGRRGDRLQYRDLRITWHSLRIGKFINNRGDCHCIIECFTIQ